MTDFRPEFGPLRKLVSEIEPGEARTAATLQNFRHMLLVARDSAPEDQLVLDLLNRFTFQASTGGLRLEPVGEETRKVVRASRRVCLIERRDGAEATGILIGPDLVLTAAHALLGTSGIFADPTQVIVRFDELRWSDGTRARGVACRLKTNAAGDQPDIVASSIKLDRRGNRDRKRINNLDYVIVRLERRIGEALLPHSSSRRRGWMDVHIAAIPPRVGPVYVLQHPQGQVLHLSDGKIERIDIEEAAAGKSFYYVTPSDLGTSGAPILNPQMIVVGMHIGATVETGQEGISWQAIHNDLVDEGVRLEANSPLERPRKVA